MPPVSSLGFAGLPLVTILSTCNSIDKLPEQLAIHFGAMPLDLK
jgi:hypothetical protein